MGGRRWIIAVSLCTFLMLGYSIVSGETPAPQPTPEGEYTVYTVRSGDTLSSIATRYGISLRAIARVNRIVDIDQIALGQALYIPSSESASVIDTEPTPLPATPFTPTTSDSTPPPLTPAVGESASATPDAVIVVETPATSDSTTSVPLDATAFAAPLPPPEFGIGLFTEPASVNADSALLIALGAQWVRLRVDWHTIETARGVFDYANLDLILATLEARGLTLLLTVSGSPSWARTAADEQGPPDDPGAFASFVGALAARYTGRVAAYEIWNEPNLRREWNSGVHAIGASAYAALLQPAYASIKAADPAAQVISAGLAPTGIDDGYNAVNDRRFLYELIALGLPSFADGIGVHPYGYAAPPDLLCCEAPADAPTHYGDPSFYFASVLTNYRDIAAATTLPLWVTAFGWGVADAPESLSQNFSYFAYNTLEEQAAFTLAALDSAGNRAPVRLMILSNVNGCAAVGDAEACYLAVNRLDGVQPPLFEALRQRALIAATP
ncbi:MAG: LysM peptidoglycan-binding domain-containing protein [Chloroflexota bacterium]|nr:LysM peptidoglycan-binding domain-containing protein [Chloroflexota bacterium]